MISLESLNFQPGIVSQISHELRIPLTGILGMTRSLEKTSLTCEQAQYLKIISISGERLLSLAENLDHIIDNKFKIDQKKGEVKNMD